MSHLTPPNITAGFGIFNSCTENQLASSSESSCRNHLGSSIPLSLQDTCLLHVLIRVEEFPVHAVSDSVLDDRNGLFLALNHALSVCALYQQARSLKEIIILNSVTFSDGDYMKEFFFRVRDLSHSYPCDFCKGQLYSAI